MNPFPIRVRVKLEGREPDALRRSTVGEQVDFVIREAQVIAIDLMIVSILKASSLHTVTDITIVLAN